MRTLFGTIAALALMAAAGLVTGGCLIKDSTNTICLEMDGAATWTVLEQRVHAVDDTPAERLREEEQFLDAARVGTHPAANAMRTLGAADVSSHVVSADWPYAVVTSARFSNIATVVQTMFDSDRDISGRSVIERRGDRVTWTIIVDYNPDANASRAPEQQPSDIEQAMTTLLSGDDDQGPVFCIRHGQFVDSVGFSIQDDGRAAKVIDLSSHNWDKDPHLVLSLTWTATEATK